MQESGPKILFVINPISGGKKKQNLEGAIREFFTGRPEQIECFILDGESDTESVRHYIETYKPDQVVAVGGDGTVSMVAGCLMNTGIPLGIVPAGSANGMATELGLPTDVEKSLEVITGGHTLQSDVLQVNDKYLCLHLSDIGLNAKLIRYFEDAGLRGMLGYAKVSLKVLMNKRMMKISIFSKGREVKREALMVILANARKYGTGALINPFGRLDDGLFEIILIKKLAFSEIFKAFINHGRFDPRKFEILQADSLAIETDHPVDFQVDGEYLGKVTRVSGKVLPSALKILVPPEPKR